MKKLMIGAMLILGIGNTANVNAQSRRITNPAVLNGTASYYHNKFEGRQTSTGEIFDQDRFTAASNTLKLGTYAKVTNLSNGEVIYVRINDRLNKANKRAIDLTHLAAEELNFIKKGLTKVKIERVDPKEGRVAIAQQNKRNGISTNRL